MRKSSSPVSLSSIYKDKNLNSSVKMRPSPASPCTTASLTAGSPESNASSLGTVVTSRTTHCWDQKASAKMKTLSIESVDSPPSIVFKKMPPVDVDYLSADWTNSSHLVVLGESKEKEWSLNDKKTFLNLSLQEQMSKVVSEHTHSELKMVYAITCHKLGIRPRIDFFKNGSKDKSRLYDFLWEKCTMLRRRQGRLVLV